MFRVERTLGPIMGCFDPDHHICVFLGHRCTKLGTEFPGIMLPGAPQTPGSHALAHDIDKGVDADCRLVDYSQLEIGKIAPASCPRVDDRCYTAVERVHQWVER